MISENNGIFRLKTNNTEYIFRTAKYGHLEHVYYGDQLFCEDIDALTVKHTAQAGSTISYDREDPLYSLDTMCFEWSGIGKGDYRFSPCEIKMPDEGFVTDFVYKDFCIKPGSIPMVNMPCAKGSDEDSASLSIRLKDKACDVYLTLVYTVYEATNILTRRVILENRDLKPLTIRRLLSMQLDMPNTGFNLTTFDGDWAKEAFRHDRRLQYGMFINESRTGSSSNKHNPGFLLYEDGATEEHGRVYGFNLIYSGNHFGFAELNSHDLVRVGHGISPHCFEWTLNTGEKFETPEAVMTFSSRGFSSLSENFHSFVNNHIIPKDWQGKERPILYNSWEPCFFKYNQRKLLKLAGMSKKLGMELFVLDDGWFEGRNDDKAGLGDYTVNKHKFPHGLKSFAKKIKKLGLDFGLWFEPEMMNENSNLYRAHPDYAVRLQGRESTLGRNQLVLDLCNPDVREYIVENVTKILDETGASYVKWDMNRHISEFGSLHISSAGRFFHSYILGLYDVLRRIFEPRPHILLESCSSGGNRFDLGMLCFSPQIWTSDNTDPMVRLNIQGGLSYLYPQSTMGAHVSDSPHQQTLRDTPLSTRYNVACFGCLGYEMDLRFLSHAERQEVKEQIAFFKEHRKTFQYGTFQRLNSYKDNKTIWLSCNDDEALIGFFQTMAGVSEGPDELRIPRLESDAFYRVSTKAQKLYIKRFGGLVKHILPLTLNPDGFILKMANRFYTLTDCIETYDCSGKALASGVMLSNQFMGSYYNDKTRLLGDFGSNLYILQKI
ncbi:MAG: alpha-galactosidase [Oscillospiraceae bacterium]|nr:alpha-galactosidase [Oscillospiraceae bacterium]